MPECRAVVNLQPNGNCYGIFRHKRSWEFRKAITSPAIFKYSTSTYHCGAHASQEHETRTGWLTKRLHMGQIIHRFAADLRRFFPKLLPKEAVEYEVESSDGLQ